MESRSLPRNPTRAVRIGSITIGAGHPIAVQSMTATHTTNIDATVSQIHDLEAAGADVVRVAVDSKKDAEALIEIRRQTRANLVIDLQENYRLAEVVAPHVNKLRYNRATFITMNGRSPGRRKSAISRQSRPITIARCGLE